MTEPRFCIPCGGSGKQLGGGMIIKDCDTCDGSGRNNKPDDEIDYLLKKDTEHYKSAKKRIQALDPNLTDEDVEKMLDGELTKLNDEQTEQPKKRGKPKVNTNG